MWGAAYIFKIYGSNIWLDFLLGLAVAIHYYLSRVMCTLYYSFRRSVYKLFLTRTPSDIYLWWILWRSICICRMRRS
jgi:hypothetical protein